MPVHESEVAFFQRFTRSFPRPRRCFVDTYDTWRGHCPGRCRPRPVAAWGASGLGGHPKPENVRGPRAARLAGARACRSLCPMGSTSTAREFCQAGADGFGVGENITCSPDAATGIGAVGKLVVNGHGKRTMKVARGSGKGDAARGCCRSIASPITICCAAPMSRRLRGRPLLQPLWRGAIALYPAAHLDDSRAAVAAQLDALPPSLRKLSPGPPAKARAGRSCCPSRCLPSAVG